MRKNQKYSKAYVYGLIERWQESGLPYTSYCRQEGINRGTFKHWLIKYRKEKGISEPGPATFIPVELSTTGLQKPSITGHGRIEINYPPAKRHL